MNSAVKICCYLLSSSIYFLLLFMDVHRNIMDMNKYNLIEQFYKLMEEFFVSEAFFMMEFDKKILVSLWIVKLIRL